MAPTALLLLLLLLAVTSLHAPAASAALSQEPPATPCAAAIVSFSPCVAHVAVVAPPALPSSAPTSACCAAFLRAVTTGDGQGGGGEGCFCHLLRDPFLLGFPVDAARLAALLPTCSSAKTSAATAAEADALFADKCRDLKTLPEMHFTPPSPPPATKLSPAAVPGPAPLTPKLEEERSTSTTPVSRDRSGSDAFCHCWVLVALVLGAAVLITLRF